jgi:hypothetical protein
MALVGFKRRWREVENNPLEVKSRWKQRYGYISCKLSSDCPTSIVLFRMSVPARDTRKDTLQQYMLVGSEN